MRKEMFIHAPPPFDEVLKTVSQFEKEFNTA